MRRTNSFKYILMNKSVFVKNGEGISEIIEIVLNTLINNLDENNENQSDENIKLIQSHNSCIVL